ncbi:DNA/RNA non-specific endonuclease [Oceanobacter mangrovi]|uniref:DNA/RNA non-specific endonuclease n=1 Tax=Oceanobacter mangrovi TaxID=2862510 RepID=UPI001C8CFF2D|nr:DNA/RNA non-specific endonuclease [Oceanobacter mangrovi]
MKVIVVILCLLAGAAQAADELCGNYGCPIGMSASNQRVERPIYILSNNATTKFADWAAYRVTPATINGPSRKRHWKADPEIAPENTLEPDDYRGAHENLQTDRGHLVPLASFSNTEFYKMTNYLSNITPQKSNLNQGPWVDLETAVRQLVETGQTVFVVTGPMYESFSGDLPGADETHRIPSGYFKIISVWQAEQPRLSAFVMPQSAGRKDNYCGFEVSVDEVERRTGLDFMPAMPKELPDGELNVENKTGGLSQDLGCQAP